jgi:hypothetical protein
LRDSLELVAERRASQAASAWQGGRVKSKLKKALSRNNGYLTLRKIREILGGNEAELENGKPELNSNDVTLFKYVSVT